MFIFLDVKRAKISPVAPNKTEIWAFQRQTLQIDFFYGFYYGFFVGIKGYFDNALHWWNEKNRKNNKIINNKVVVIHAFGYRGFFIIHPSNCYIYCWQSEQPTAHGGMVLIWRYPLPHSGLALNKSIPKF